MKKFLIGLGVPKAGTTWLHGALRSHPGVGGIPRKEIHYIQRQYGDLDRLTDNARLAQFAQQLRRFEMTPGQMSQPRLVQLEAETYGSPQDAEIAERWRPGGVSTKRYKTLVGILNWYKKFLKGPVNEEWYRSLFSDVPEDKWASDFSTTNFRASDEGYAELAQLTEDTRAILILRDPIDRLWSHIRFHAEVTNDFANLEVWSTPAIRDFTAHHELGKWSLYADAVERLIRHFPPEKRLILNFDDIVKRPATVFADVLSFLDLEPMELPSAARKRETVAASKPLRMRKGLLSHLAPGFREDLQRVQDLGVDFVGPWIAHAEAHAAERAEADPFGALSLYRRVYRRVRSDMERRERYSKPRF